MTMQAPACLAALLAALAMAPSAWAHAFPDNTSPHVGASVKSAPHEVKVWFDGKLEPVFSTLVVKDAAGEQVSTGKGNVDATDHALLETALPATLPDGTYTVYWSVVAHDGHHTAGHFVFTVQ
ncbi:MAG TPA: copper resistance protein CopC [Rhodanobacteraceae bacterium]|nr:copper resistance protein CopC [Rhodanobacteraceae bacterium]